MTVLSDLPSGEDGGDWLDTLKWDEQGLVPAIAQDVAQRNDRDVIDGLGGALRRRIVGAHRLDGVADVLEPDGLGLAGRKEIEDATPNGEFAVLVSRILAPEPSID